MTDEEFKAKLAARPHLIHPGCTCGRSHYPAAVELDQPEADAFGAFLTQARMLCTLSDLCDASVIAAAAGLVRYVAASMAERSGTTAEELVAQATKVADDWFRYHAEQGAKMELNPTGVTH